MKNKLLLLFSFGIVVSVVVTILFYAAGASRGGISITESIIIVAVLFLAAMSALIATDSFRNVRAGLPLKDERERRVWYKAGYYAYLASIYIILGTSLFSDFIIEDLGLTDFDIGRAAGVTILLSGIIFIGLYFFFRRTGRVE